MEPSCIFHDTALHYIPIQREGSDNNQNPQSKDGLDYQTGITITMPQLELFHMHNHIIMYIYFFISIIVITNNYYYRSIL